MENLSTQPVLYRVVYRPNSLADEATREYPHHTAHTSDPHKYTKENKSSTHTPSCTSRICFCWSKKSRKKELDKIYLGKKQHPRNMWSTSQLYSFLSPSCVYFLLIASRIDNSSLSLLPVRCNSLCVCAQAIQRCMRLLVWALALSSLSVYNVCKGRPAQSPLSRCEFIQKKKKA